MTTAASDPQQGLEKAVTARTPEVIKTSEEFRGTLLRWKEQSFNVLAPFTNISGLAPHHGILSSGVVLSTDRALGEVYDGLPFLRKDEYAIAKTGLRKLAECAGISTHTIRTDPRNIPFYWEFKAIASYRGVDGSIITREASKDWDLRDGSPQMKGWTANQVEEGRKHGLRNCEARAINAAIRECGCGIKQKYTKAELAKPFAILRVAFLPDMSDPDIKRMVTERALGGTSALYAGVPATLPAGPEVDGDRSAEEPRKVGSGSTSKAKEDPEAEEPQPPPTADAVRIADIKKVEGTNQQSGRKWTKWLIVDSKNQEHSTFSSTIRDDAQRLKDANEWVEFDDESTEDGKFSNIVQIHVPQPSLLPDDL